MIYCIKATYYQDPQHFFFFLYCVMNPLAPSYASHVLYSILAVQEGVVYVSICAHTSSNSSMLVCHPCLLLLLLLLWCRTERIRWKYVVQYFLEFVFTIVVLVMCVKNFIRPSLEMIPSNPAKCVCPRSHKTSLWSSGSLG